jgi:hypothetical protein
MKNKQVEKPAMLLRILMIAAAALACGQIYAADIIIEPDVVVLIDQTESQPIHLAMQDLVRDLDKVLGKKPQVVSRLEDCPSDAAFIVVSCQGSETEKFRKSEITDFESHLVYAYNDDAHKAVVLQGADMRGTIYAIYTFSEKFLDIPPLWVWASHQPQRTKHIEVSEDAYLYFSSAYVKWRAWFPNDRDLIHPWQRRSGENYDAIYETMLRLKLNTFELALSITDEPVLYESPTGHSPYKAHYKAGKDVCRARDRGLKVSFTHTSPFGANFGSWQRYWQDIRKKEVPTLSVKNIAQMKEFWQYHIETILREEMDVIWQLGFRSSGDKAFWETFADSPKEDSERAKVIEFMLNEQVRLLEQVTGKSNQLMKITFYNEVSDFLAAGLLELPKEPNLIWSFVAARRDHFPAEDIRNISISDDQPIGYYMNFQFTSSGSHLAPAEGPWKMEKNFRFVDGKSPKPLHFSVVNAGNVREHVLELSANAQMMWDYDKYNTDEFLRQYCRNYYGDTYAEEIAQLYKDFYNSYWLPKKNDLPEFDRQYIFQDMRYSRAIEGLHRVWNSDFDPNPLGDRWLDSGGRYFRIVPADNDAENQLQAILKGTEKAMAGFGDVAKRAHFLGRRLSHRHRRFFEDDLRLQAMFMYELNRALNNVANAYIEKNRHPERSRRHLVAALDAVEKLIRAKKQAEHGVFKDWYKSDRLFRMEGLREKISELLEL